MGINKKAKKLSDKLLKLKKKHEHHQTKMQKFASKIVEHEELFQDALAAKEQKASQPLAKKKKDAATPVH